MVFVSAILGGGTGLSSSAQEAASDIAYVEAVIGRVVAFAAHRAPAPFLVDTLDVISDRTRFDQQRTASCVCAIIAYAAF